MAHHYYEQAHLPSITEGSTPSELIYSDPFGRLSPPSSPTLQARPLARRPKTAGGSADPSPPGSFTPAPPSWSLRRSQTVSRPKTSPASPAAAPAPRPILNQLPSSVRLPSMAGTATATSASMSPARKHNRVASMDRSSTPRIPQLSVINAYGSATPNGSSTPRQESARRLGGEVSASPVVQPVTGATSGLLSWVRSALALGPPATISLTEAPEEDAGNVGLTTPRRASSIASQGAKRSSYISLGGASSNRYSFSLDGRSTLDDEDTEEDQEEDRESSSGGDDADEAEQVYTPFTTRDVGPSLIRPSATREAAFARSSNGGGVKISIDENGAPVTRREASESSLPEGQVLLDGAPLPGTNVATAPVTGPTSGKQWTFGGTLEGDWLPGANKDGGETVSVPADEILRGISNNTQLVIEDTSDSTGQVAPSVVLTPPGAEGIDIPQPPMSRIAGWVDGEELARMRTEMDSTPRNAPASIARSVDGDGELLADEMGRPMSPADLVAARPSKEKVVLGTRGASIREGGRQNNGGRARSASQRIAMAQRAREQAREGSEATVAGQNDEVLEVLEGDETMTGGGLPPLAGPPASTTSKSAKRAARVFRSEAGPSPSSQAELGKGVPARHRRVGSESLVAAEINASLEAPQPQRKARLSLFGRSRRDASTSSSTVGPGSRAPSSSLGPSDGLSASEATPPTSAGGWRFGLRAPSSALGRSASISSSRTAGSAPPVGSTGTAATPSLVVDKPLPAILPPPSSPSLGRGSSFDDGGASYKAQAASIKSKKLALGILAGPKQVKTQARKKSSKERDFGRLFLVQEVPLNVPVGFPAQLPRRDTDVSTSSMGTGDHHGSDARSSGSHGRKDSAPTQRPPLPNGLSEASLSSHTGSVGSQSGCLSKGSSVVGGSSNSAIRRRKATWAMKVSVDGKYLAVAGQDCVIRIFAVLDSVEARQSELDTQRFQLDAATGGSTDSGPVRTSGTASQQSSLRSRTGDSAALKAAAANFVKAPVLSSEPVIEFHGHSNDILDLSWSKGGFLLSASMDKTARLWHPSSGPNSLVSWVHGDFVTGVAFHPKDDRFFLSGCLDGKLRLWNIPAKRVQCSQEVPGLITACAFTKSGAVACAGTFSGAALFYHTEGLAYHTSIAVRSASGKNARGGRKITGIEPLAADATGAERVLVTSNDSKIRAYRLSDKTMSGRWKASSYVNRTSQIRASVTDDGAYVIAGSEASGEGGSVHVWDLSSALKESVASSGAKKGSSAPSMIEGGVESWLAHSGTVTCATMLPLASHAWLRSSDDPILLLEEIENKRAAQPLDVAATASRRNRIVVSVDENAVLRVWRADSNQALGRPA